MKIQDSVAFVTGANRGLGLAFTRALLAAGARKVYAAARNPVAVTLPGVAPIRLDITNPAEIAAAVRECGDVSLLINNAGVLLNTSLFADGALEAARKEMETHYFAPWQLSAAFAPVLARNGGGAIVNILSVLSWLNLPKHATYSVSKAAQWSLTNGLRGELRGQGTQVVGVHVGYMDTDMTDGIDAAKANPDDVARQVLASVEAGSNEVLADQLARDIKQGLSAEPGVYIR